MVLATVPGGASDEKEPTGDFLSGTDFGERTEGGWIEIQGESFMVSVEFLGGSHSESPVGLASIRAIPACDRDSSHVAHDSEIPDRLIRHCVILLRRK
jgi:hypothetical protein